MTFLPVEGRVSSPPFFTFSSTQKSLINFPTTLLWPAGDKSLTILTIFSFLVGFVHLCGDPFLNSVLQLKQTWTDFSAGFSGLVGSLGLPASFLIPFELLKPASPRFDPI